MIFTRVKRGATRTFILANHTFNQLRAYRPRITWQSTQKTLLSLLVVRTVLIPIPLAAPATAMAATLDDTEPPRLVRIDQVAVNALSFNTSGDVLVVATPALQPITVGESLAEQQAQAAAAAAALAAKEAAQARARAAEITAAAATAPAYSVDTIKAIIITAASEYGVDANLMLRIAQCESGYNPRSFNPSGASGLFQFMYGTYRNSPSGVAGRSIWDPQANAEAAAYKISHGGLNAWSASESCWAR